MNNNTVTAIVAVLALGSVAGAYSMRPQPLPPAQFEDTGELWFADFTDPTLATSLSVVAWNEETAQVVSFSVAQKAGRWVIPSHNDYPADGTERMGKAAASFIDVKKDRYFGDSVADHAAFGVLDPEGAEGKDDERGQRITIKDASDTTLVDIIVGKEIPDKPGYYYVREPGETKRVYGSKLELDISTDFEDWIEKDLLGVERDEFVSMVYDPYTVDEVEGKVTGFDPILAKVVDPANPREWTLDGTTVAPDGKALDSNKVRQMLTAMASLKIVGVRPRPTSRNMIEQQILAQDMKRKGFFVVPTPDGRQQLYANEGMLSAVTADGIVYTLLFGEVTYESGIALTAGVAGDDDADEKGVVEQGVDDPAANDGKKASRFLFVDVGYDPSADTTLSGGSSDPADGDTPIEQAEDEKKKLEGQERATKLRNRFDQWFYVISDSSYTQIHKSRDELWKAAPTDAEAAPPAMPSMGMPPMGMPPG